MTIDRENNLEIVRDELLDRIDGAEESRGFDAWLSEMIRQVDAVIERLEGPGR